MGHDQVPPMPKYEVDPNRPRPTAQYEVSPSAGAPTRVTVVDFDMSFGHLVMFFVKAAIAAIRPPLFL